MSSLVHQIICSLLVILVVVLDQGHATGHFCSWSNEHCSRDSDCCSKSCFRAFEGTNPRCRHSALAEMCIFNFHCADDLECGSNHNCCSPYWKMCTKTADCCDPMHVCKPADGFYYNRCLYPNAGHSNLLLHVTSGPLLPRSKFWSCVVLQSVVVFVAVLFSSSTTWR